MNGIMQASIMLTILLLLLAYILFKLKNINKYNLLILLVLSLLWISAGIISTSIIKFDFDSLWKWPIIISIPHFTQAATRLALGKFSQKINSRKIPIVIATTLFISSLIPLMFNQSFATLLVASFGFGMFAMTYGMQNQYWSENWDIKNVFATIGILFITQHIGKFIGQIVNLSIVINEDSIVWISLSMIILSVIVTIVYSIIVKERKETILIDNKSSYAKYVSDFKIKHILILSLLIYFVTLAVNLVNSGSFIGSNNNEFVTISGLVITVISSLITVFILVKLLDDRYIEYAAIITSLLGAILMLISLFTIKSLALSFAGLMLLLVGTASYTVNQMGMILHIDHKNTFLVLGIWLTFKSLAIGMGKLVGAEIQLNFPDISKYLIIATISFLLISFLMSVIVYKKYTKPAYDLIEKLERENTII